MDKAIIELVVIFLRIKFSFFKAVILVALLVFLGLKAAVGGMQKILPEVTPSLWKLSLHQKVLAITALGDDYSINLETGFHYLEGLLEGIKNTFWLLCKSWQGRAL